MRRFISAEHSTDIPCIVIIPVLNKVIKAIHLSRCPTSGSFYDEIPLRRFKFGLPLNKICMYISYRVYCLLEEIICTKASTQTLAIKRARETWTKV